MPNWRSPMETPPAALLDALIDDGDVLTAGGGAAGMDLGLHLIRSMCGARVANRLARNMVVPPHRPGGQAQFIESPLPQLDEEDPVAESMAWALTQPDTLLPIDEMARYCGFSSAAALRPHFRRLVGVVPAAYRETFSAVGSLS